MCPASGQMKAKAKEELIISRVQGLYCICALARDVNHSYWGQEL